jgi:predicted PurR-regulated permease PerM
MDETPKRRREDAWRLRPIRIAFIILTIVFFAVLVGFAWVVHDVQQNSGRINTLVAENSNRIHDVQQSRVESCQKTYEGIREVFKPFFPQHPTNKQQIDNLEKFNTTINKLKAACDKQTKP